MNILQILKQDKDERRHMIMEGPLLPSLMLMSAPNILMIVINQLIPIMDNFFIYRYAGLATGAVTSYVGSLIGIFTMGVQGLAVAGSAIIGQTIGSGDMEAGRKMSLQYIISAVAAGVVLIPIITGCVFWTSFGVEAALRPGVMIYGFLNSLIMPFFILQNSFNTIKNSQGRPEDNFYRLLIFLPIKVFFTFLFVSVLRLNVVGAGLSTVCAYVLISVYLCYDLFIKKTDMRLSLKGYRPDFRFLGRLYRLAFPAILQQSFKSLGFFLLKLETAKYGSIYLNAQGISDSIYGVFNALGMFCDVAVTTMVSLNVGAGNPERARRMARLGYRIAFCVALVLAGIVTIIAPMAARIFTDDPTVIRNAVRITWINAGSIPLMSFIFIQAAAFNGLGMTKINLVIQMIRIWVVRFASMYLMYWLIPGIGVWSPMYSFLICNLVTVFISMYYYRKIDWTHRLA